MKKKLQTPFLTRQYMVSKDFELYYYSDLNLPPVPSHAHDYYEFYFFLKGDVSYQIGDKRYAVVKGDMLLIPPHVRHRSIVHDPKQPYQRFVFWISREFLENLLELSPDYGYLIQLAEKQKEYVFHHDLISFNTIQSKLLRLLEEMETVRYGHNAQLSICIHDLILHLNRQVYESKNPAQVDAQSLYQNLCAFLEEHLDEDLSLERLAKEFYVSKYHIAHIFKENLGISIHQYITKKRLALCRQAIQGQMTITEAYQSFGFGDYSSFYRAFKKEYGVSPKEYQQLNEKNLPGPMS